MWKNSNIVSVLKPLSRICMLLILAACNSAKYLPEDRPILASYEIKWRAEKLSAEEKRAVESELRQVLRPRPNNVFLGMRLGLWAELRTDAGKKGILTRYIKRRYGEKPVYISDIERAKLTTLLQNRLENNGLFFSEIEMSWKPKRKHTTALEIKLNTSPPYRVEELTYKESGRMIMDSIIQKNLSETILKNGCILSMEKMKDERSRLQQVLREEGFYYFQPDHLIFDVDTTNTSGRKAQLYMKLQKETDEKALRRYYLRSVTVFSNYKQTGVQANGQDRADSTVFVYRNLYFKDKYLEPFIELKPGDAFSLYKQRKTSRYLGNLEAYRYVNIRFRETESDSISKKQSGNLDVQVFLSPRTQKSLRAEIQAVTRSNNFAGPAFIPSYTNRNIFKGGEVFRLQGKFSFETQLGGGEISQLYSYEAGIKAIFDFPRVIAPFISYKQTAYSIPKTRLQGGVNFLQRATFYTLNSFDFSYGFLWQSSSRWYHDFRPLDFIYSNLLNTSSEFDEILDNNLFLRRSFERQFIPAMSYTLTYNELSVSQRRLKLFAMTHLESSGTVLSQAQGAFGAEPELLGLPYAQYVKGELDFRLYKDIGASRKLILRNFAGMGYTYGNSMSLPFVKQYFSGGPNSIRAFRIRSLGPGGYVPEDQSSIGAFFDQSGDIKLEMNLEYRFPIASVLKGAWFVDAGNIWLLRDNPSLPDAAFTSDWFNQLAIGAGFGLRIDINFFVIRFDLATPIRLHAADDGNVWAINDFNPLDGSWYRNGLLLNFALGYPF